MKKYTIKKMKSEEVQEVTPLQYLFKVEEDDSEIYQECCKEYEMLRKVLIIMRNRFECLTGERFIVLNNIDYKDICRALGETPEEIE